MDNSWVHNPLCYNGNSNVLFISTVQQNDSVIHIYTFYFIFFSISLSQDIEHNSLCYTVGPCYLSILCIIICICLSQTPNPSLLHPLSPWKPKVCSLCLSVCFCFVDKFIYVILQVPHISDIIWYLSFSLRPLLIHLL